MFLLWSHIGVSCTTCIDTKDDTNLYEYFFSFAQMFQITWWCSYLLRRHFPLGKNCSCICWCLIFESSYLRALGKNKLLCWCFAYFMTLWEFPRLCFVQEFSSSLWNYHKNHLSCFLEITFLSFSIHRQLWK